MLYSSGWWFPTSWWLPQPTHDLRPMTFRTAANHHHQFNVADFKACNFVWVQSEFSWHKKNVFFLRKRCKKLVAGSIPCLSLWECEWLWTVWCYQIEYRMPEKINLPATTPTKNLKRKWHHGPETLRSMMSCCCFLCLLFSLISSINEWRSWWLWGLPLLLQSQRWVMEGGSKPKTSEAVTWGRLTSSHLCLVSSGLKVLLRRQILVGKQRCINNPLMWSPPSSLTEGGGVRGLLLKWWRCRYLDELQRGARKRGEHRGERVR